MEGQSYSMSFVPFLFYEMSKSIIIQIGTIMFMRIPSDNIKKAFRECQIKN